MCFACGIPGSTWKASLVFFFFFSEQVLEAGLVAKAVGPLVLTHTDSSETSRPWSARVAADCAVVASAAAFTYEGSLDLWPVQLASLLCWQVVEGGPHPMQSRKLKQRSVQGYQPHTEIETRTHTHTHTHTHMH